MHTDPQDRFTSKQQMLARFNASRNFAWVAQKESSGDGNCAVQRAESEGHLLQKEFKRLYPNNNLAAQMLGYVGTDDVGLVGWNASRMTSMHGIPGRVLTAIDARRHVLDSEEREPMPGENLVLSSTPTFSSWRKRPSTARWR